MHPVPFVSASDLNRVLDPPSLIDALAEAFRSQTDPLPRAHHDVGPGSLLLMPAVHAGLIGVKVSTAFPDNGQHGKPTTQGTYLLLDGATGETRAFMDGRALTMHRTAAASALACRYLARENTSTMVMVGAGTLAPYLVRAHASVRPITRVRVWNRTAERAHDVAATLSAEISDSQAVTELGDAISCADLVSCATPSRVPLVHAADLRAGTHLDLVGAYRPEMRETDGAVFRDARVFVDSLNGARDEAGDILQAVAESAFRFEQIAGTLSDLAAGRHVGRQRPDQITIFKSVGVSIQDLAAAALAAERLGL